jgi:magnesium-transporting ATPase (P-type)
MYVVWFWSSYLFVAVVEFSVVVVGAVASTYIQATNEATIAVLTEYETTVRVRRNGVTETISSDLLVPGDVVLISAVNWVLPCDMVLLTGLTLFFFLLLLLLFLFRGTDSLCSSPNTSRITTPRLIT